MNHSIFDRLIYQIASYVYSFFIINVYFMLLISPFLYVFFFAEFTVQNIFLYYVTLLLFGPAFSALLKTADKMVIDKIIAPTKLYWTYFFRDFKIAMLYWLIQSTILLILIVDIYYANLFAPFISYVFLILLVFALLVMMYAFPILTRFEVRIKNLFIISVYALFRFIKTTFLNATTLIAFGFIFYNVPNMMSLFLMSLVGFFMMYNLQVPLEILEDMFVNQKQKGENQDEA